MARYVRRVPTDGRWTTVEFDDLYDAVMHDRDYYGWGVALRNLWHDIKKAIRRIVL